LGQNYSTALQLTYNKIHGSFLILKRFFS